MQLCVVDRTFHDSQPGLRWNVAPKGETALLLSPTSHRPQRSARGSSPPNQNGPTACPGTPGPRSVRRHTEQSDGPPGRGPSTPLLRSTLSGCPVVGAIEHRSANSRRSQQFSDVHGEPLTGWLIQLLGTSGLPLSLRTLSFMLSTHGLSLRFPNGGSYSLTSANVGRKKGVCLKETFTSTALVRLDQTAALRGTNMHNSKESLCCELKLQVAT